MCVADPRVRESKKSVDLAMAGVVGVWFAKFGREAAPAAEAEAEVVGRRHQGDGLLEVEAVKTVQIQERRRRNSAVLANSEDTVCMLMDRFAPA